MRLRLPLAHTPSFGFKSFTLCDYILEYGSQQTAVTGTVLCVCVRERKRETDEYFIAAISKMRIGTNLSFRHSTTLNRTINH